MAKPRVEIDMAEVERLAGLGLTQEEIATSLGFSERTFRNRKKDSAAFADAIKRGKASAAEEISNQLFEKAKTGDLGAIIWYEKTRCGRTDKLTIDLSKLTDEQLAALLGGKA